MKRVSTFILKAAIIFMALAVLGFCGLTGYDLATKGLGGYAPVFIGIYASVIPFFIALYHGFKLLNLIDKNKAFSKRSVRALKYVQYCAFIISGLYVANMPYIYLIADSDDAPGIIVFAMGFIFVSFVTGVAAGLSRNLLQNAIDIKSENDLTV